VAALKAQSRLVLSSVAVCIKRLAWAGVGALCGETGCCGCLFVVCGGLGDVATTQPRLVVARLEYNGRGDASSSVVCVVRG
jgi:hypothetical protein